MRAQLTPVFLAVVLAGAGLCSAVASDAAFRNGDTIELRIGGVPAEETQLVTGAYTVDGEGYINLPHIGKVRASGLSQAALQSACAGGQHDAREGERGLVQRRRVAAAGHALQQFGGAVGNRDDGGVDAVERPVERRQRAARGDRAQVDAAPRGSVGLARGGEDVDHAREHRRPVPVGAQVDVGPAVGAERLRAGFAEDGGHAVHQRSPPRMSTA